MTKPVATSPQLICESTWTRLSHQPATEQTFGPRTCSIQNRNANHPMVTVDGKVVNFTLYTGCFQDTTYQIHHTYTATLHSNGYILLLLYTAMSTFHCCSTQQCLHSNHLALLHLVNCLQKWLIWFDAALLWFDSLIMVPCGPKHVAVFNMML
jgi:hypothetical protein